MPGVLVQVAVLGKKEWARREGGPRLHREEVDRLGDPGTFGQKRGSGVQTSGKVQRVGLHRLLPLLTQWSVVARARQRLSMRLGPGHGARSLAHRAGRQVADTSEGEPLKTPETARELSKFLKTNQRVCSAVGPLYVVELGRLYHDLMNVYTVYADYQKLMVDSQGEIAMHNSLYKQLRSVKKETLRLLTTFVDKCGEPEAPAPTVAQSLLPLLLQPTPSSVLGDYNRSVPAARDAEVLKLFSMCIERLPMNEAEGGQAVPRVMEALFAR